MGNFVAEMQLREVFDQLPGRAPHVGSANPSYLTGNFVRAVNSMLYSL
ncbi:hypothetical protein ACFXO9_27075 [Nocardia tengchongensis]